MTRLANRLVRDGLVERTTDPSDRRAVVLTPTRLGDRTAERVKAWRLRALARRFAGVDADDARTLDAALSTVASLLLEEED
jgi:DNA-binding MarR family transcriptional regulator